MSNIHPKYAFSTVGLACSTLCFALAATASAADQGPRVETAQRMIARFQQAQSPALQAEPGPRGAERPLEPTEPPIPRRSVPRSPRFKPLGAINIDIALSKGDLPVDHSDEEFGPRDAPDEIGLTSKGWMPTEFQWEPTDLAHKPLYWDDVPLERYGQTCSPLMQPVISSGLFWGNFFVMPYKLLIDHPHEPVYTLGYYRVGSCTPCVHQCLPCCLERPALLCPYCPCDEDCSCDCECE